MSELHLLEKAPDVESIVELCRQVNGAHLSQSRLAVREKLGPGVVRALGRIDHPDRGHKSRELDRAGLAGHIELICVHWPSADLDTWVAPEEVEGYGEKARLLAIYREGAGKETESCVFEKCKVIANAGLNYNWTVELFPGNIIRTVRSDGLAWTFDWNPVVEHAHPHGTILVDALAEDDHAEALTVAELATA